MTVTLGILALLEAKAGKGEQLTAFLKAGECLMNEYRARRYPPPVLA